MEENVHWLRNPNTVDTLDETKHGKGRATAAERPQNSEFTWMKKLLRSDPYLSIR